MPRKLAPFLTGHEIQTLIGMKWGGIKNGALLALIEHEGFEVFITGDKNIRTSSSSKVYRSAL